MRSTMLLNNIYIIGSCESSASGDKVTCEIKLNGDHDVFKGHFPGNPILPGVCTVQIIRELLEMQLGKKLRLTKAGNIKYLGFISPLASPMVKFELLIRFTETGAVSCNATAFSEGTARCSFKGEYEKFSSHTQ